MELSKSQPPKFSVDVLAKQLARDVRVDPPKNDIVAQEEHAFKKDWNEYLGGEKKLQAEEEMSQEEILERSDEDELEAYLKTEAGFASEHIKVKVEGSNNYAPIIMDDYQIDLLMNRGRFVFVKKARRIGLSYLTSMRGLVRAHLKDGFDSYFISRNLDEAKEKIKYAIEMYATIPEFAQRDLASKAVKSQLEFRSADGRSVSRLISHPQTEPRGREGDIYLDEFSSYQSQKEVYMAATHCLLRTGTLWIVSTPRNKGDLFHSIDQATKDKYTAFNGNRFAIPWWHCRIMVKDGMFEDAFQNAPGMDTTRDRVYTYGTDRVVQIYESASIEGDFQVEMELQYADDSMSYFGAEPLECVFGVDDPRFAATIEWATDQEASVSPVEKILDKRKISKFYTDNISELIEKVECGHDVGRSFVLGVDPGFTDGCGIACIDESNLNMAVLRSITKFVGIEYCEIEALVINMMKKLPVRKIGVDTRGGEGRALVSRLRDVLDDRHQDKIVEIATDNNTNNDMALNLKKRFEEHTIAIPMHDDLLRDIKKVMRVYNENTGQAGIHVKRDRKYGHGDMYFALGYAAMNLTDKPQELQELRTPNYAKLGIPVRKFQGSPAVAVQKFKDIMKGVPQPSRHDFGDIKIGGVFGVEGLPRP